MNAQSSNAHHLDPESFYFSIFLFSFLNTCALDMATKPLTWSKCIFLFFETDISHREPSLSRVYNREPASFNVALNFSINGSTISQQSVSGLVTDCWRRQNKIIKHLFESSPTILRKVLYKKAPIFQANHQLSAIASTCLLSAYSVVHDASHFYGNRNFVEFYVEFWLLNLFWICYFFKKAFISAVCLIGFVHSNSIPYKLSERNSGKPFKCFNL
jgi:hypothetical protein